jgi:hypothetical protein
MIYYLFANSLNVISITLLDYPIQGIEIVGIEESDLLPLYLVVSTDIFGDKGVYEQFDTYLKNIGYDGNFKLLKPLSKNLALVDDFEIVPPF